KQVTCSGLKPVFRIELQDGKTITCTKKHRFLTREGWQSLEDIVGGVVVTDKGMAVYGSNSAEIMVNGVPAYKDPAWLREQYVIHNLDQETLAQLAGVSPHTIRAWIRKHRLQKPQGSWARGVSTWNKGKRYKPGWRHTEETRRLMSQQKRGVGNPQWRGGITQDAIKMRRDIEDIRPQMLERDHYRCRLCGNTHKQLDMHHVLPIWARPDLALAVDNIVTLCRPCHKKVNNHEEEYVDMFGRTKA